MENNQHPKADEVSELKGGLQTKWDDLKKMSKEYQEKLDESLKAKQVREKYDFL